MLDAFIIEELRRREQRERQDREAPVLRLPVDDEKPVRPSSEKTDSDSKRGVIIIDI